jgi:YggT family protein
MFVLGHFLAGLAAVLEMALSLYVWVLIINAVLSWVNPDPGNPIVRFLHAATWPLLHEIRRRLPVLHGGIDLSSLVAILGIYLLQYVLVASLRDVAVRLLAL